MLPTELLPVSSWLLNQLKVPAKIEGGDFMTLASVVQQYRQDLLEIGQQEVAIESAMSKDATWLAVSGAEEHATQRKDILLDQALSVMKPKELMTTLPALPRSGIWAAYIERITLRQLIPYDA